MFSNSSAGLFSLPTRYVMVAASRSGSTCAVMRLSSPICSTFSSQASRSEEFGARSRASVDSTAPFAGFTLTSIAASPRSFGFVGHHHSRISMVAAFSRSVGKGAARAVPTRRCARFALRTLRKRFPEIRAQPLEIAQRVLARRDRRVRHQDHVGMAAELEQRLVRARGLVVADVEREAA